MTVETLNKRLFEFSYFDGFTASQNDVDEFAKFTAEPDAKFVNAARWWRHINSFTDKERAAWPKGAEVVEEATKADDDEESESESESDDEEMSFEIESDEDKAKRIADEKEKAKKAKKKEPVGKSSILMDIKPWSDETDLDLLEQKLRAMKIDGLHWGATKRAEIAFGLKKLVFMITIIDDKCSSADIEDIFSEDGPLADMVQSMDIVVWNKI